MARWNVLRAFFRRNSIRKNLLSLWCYENPVFSLSQSLIPICQYPELVSSVENMHTSFSKFKRSSIRWTG